MTSSDQDKEGFSSEDDIEKIKREEKEDPTAYYSQEDSIDNFNEEAELSKPVPPVEKASEEINLTKAVAYLGFGLAALAIVFILFFIRDLEDRVGGVDSAVNILEEKIAPLKKEVNDSLEKVNADIATLTAKMVNSESRLAVMELKRALIAIQGMKMNTNPEVKEKSTQLITNIELLIGQLNGSKQETAPVLEQVPAGEIIVKEEPVIELPIVDSMVEQQASTDDDIMEESPPPSTVEPDLTLEDVESIDNEVNTKNNDADSSDDEKMEGDIDGGEEEEDEEEDEEEEEE